MKKKRVGYFECGTEDPAPLCVATKCRVAFSEVDLMGIAWHGRYASFFEKASTELCRAAGLSKPICAPLSCACMWTTPGRCCSTRKSSWKPA